MQSTRRVVVTGLGALSSLGTTVAEFWDALMAGRSGIGHITSFDTEEYRSRIGGEIKDLDMAPLLPPKEARRLDPFCHYAIHTADQALRQAGLIDADLDKERIGVYVGSGIGGILTLEEQTRRLITNGPGKVSPFLVPMMISDMASGCISMRYGFRGPNLGIVSACATGTHSLGEAMWAIKRGSADMMLAGGAEACISRVGIAGFCAMKALSERNDEPEKASRPFDAERDGFVIAEGAGILVLEDLDHAKARGATILAELTGYGASADAYHVTQPCPGGDGAAVAIRAALKEAGLQPTDVDYVNAHGTSTPFNDKFETMAIKQVLGDHAYKVPVSSTKSLTGHTLGAAGGLETIACIMAILEKRVPGTYNYTTPDPECDLDYVPNETRAVDVKTALNLNFGFGGHNGVIVVRRYED